MNNGMDTDQHNATGRDQYPAVAEGTGHESYDRFREIVAELADFANQGFPGADLAELVAFRQVAEEAEQAAAQQRFFAERKFDAAMRGAFEIRDEVAAANIPLAYRAAIYKERLGVKRGTFCFRWLEEVDESDDLRTEARHAEKSHEQS